MRYLLAFIMLVCGVCPAVAAKDLPFATGEKMTFNLRWGIIAAGTVVLEVLEPEIIDGVPALHFRMTARTTSFIDTFYKIRDQLDSYTDMALTHGLLFRKKQREGRTRRDITVDFDPAELTARYSNYGKDQQETSILPGTFDPLSVFYMVRTQPMEINREIKLPVSDGKKTSVGSATVLKRETIRIDDQEYDTYLLEPDLKDVRGVFEKSKESKLKVWITADQRRLLVKVKSKVIVGSFVAELVSHESGTAQQTTLLSSP